MLVGAALLALGGAPYPLYRQCDGRWGTDLMGVDGPGHRATVCREGCAVSCLAMVLASAGFAVGGEVATPGSLNAWLVSHAGYRCAAGDCDNLVLDAIDRLSGGRVRFVGEWPAASLDLAKALAPAGGGLGEAAFVGHVRNPLSGRLDHFVLLRSYESAADSFEVHDPLFNETSYARANVSDVLIYEGIPPSGVVPLAYPLRKQCDPAWADDVIHIKTVCAVGCLMSSTSMALRQRGVPIPVDTPAEEAPAAFPTARPPVEATPGSLNAWLRTHGGYVPGTDDLEESAVSGLDPQRIRWTNASMHTTNDLSWSHVVGLLDSGAAVIANVLHGRHFVLVVGYDRATSGDVLYVNDPGFWRSSYSFADDVVGWRLYAMQHRGAALEGQLAAIGATARPRRT